VIYKWLVEIGKTLSYYNDKAMIKKEGGISQQTGGLTSREADKKAPMTETQKELQKMQILMKEKDKQIADLREENESLKNGNEKLKNELKQFQDQFLTLMKLLENVISDETITIPNHLSAEQLK